MIISHCTTKASLTHGPSDQERSNLDKTDHEEHTVMARGYEGSSEGQNRPTSALIHLEIKNFNV